MLSIFDHSDYRQFLRLRLASLPKRGRGQLRAWAEHLRVHTSHISQVMNGSRDFSEEQVIELAEFLGMAELEETYFLELTRLSRAASKKLKNRIEVRIQQLREKSQRIQEWLPKKTVVLSEADRATFYSDWMYSAVRLLTSVPEYQTIDSLAAYFGQDRNRIRQVIEFLLRAGLCNEKNGRYEIAMLRTHLPPESPLIRRLHANWRIQSLKSIENNSEKNLHFTCPMVLSEKDIQRIRNSLLEQIGTVQKWVDASPSEKLVCLNIDLFRV